LGKIKYDDKVLHRSKLIKIFTEEQSNKEKINKDFVKMFFGLSVSVAIVLAIHYFIIPKGLY